MEVWLSFIQEVGFPAVVTLYLLYRIETKLEALNGSVIELPEKIAECTIKNREVS
ncbi:YvrJ family protein [Massilibacterium senegalense]|uniref:YvrJ family protein n=1 Tax=Massilibacterium senegalense TaxID=1632858 RepID=UPI000782BDE7|nr:YvrJ family protein [Massilibacterium senegalense]